MMVPVGYCGVMLAYVGLVGFCRGLMVYVGVCCFPGFMCFCWHMNVYAGFVGLWSLSRLMLVLISLCGVYWLMRVYVGHL